MYLEADGQTEYALPNTVSLIFVPLTFEAVRCLLSHPVYQLLWGKHSHKMDNANETQQLFTAQLVQTVQDFDIREHCSLPACG